MYGRAPTCIYLSDHPALQTKKANEQGDVRKLQAKTPQGRGRAGALVDREFRTSRRALNVLSVRAGLSEQATKAPGAPGQPRS